MAARKTAAKKPAKKPARKTARKTAAKGTPIRIIKTMGMLYEDGRDTRGCIVALLDHHKKDGNPYTTYLPCSAVKIPQESFVVGAELRVSFTVHN